MDWRRDCAAIIPCKDEAATIGTLVEEVLKIVACVIVVDDGSSDSTGRIAARSGATVLRRDGHPGKGAALRAGLRHSQDQGFRWALTMDGDGQHSPSDLPRLLRAAEGMADPSLLIGNRMNNSQEMPWQRRATNRVMSWILTKLTSRDLPDTQCGLRLLNLEKAMGLGLRSSSFQIESEMLISFLAAGNEVAFVPIQTLYKLGRSKIRPFRDSILWFRWLFSAREQLAHIRRNKPLQAASSIAG